MDEDPPAAITTGAGLNITLEPEEEQMYDPVKRCICAIMKHVNVHDAETALPASRETLRNASASGSRSPRSKERSWIKNTAIAFAGTALSTYSLS